MYHGMFEAGDMFRVNDEIKSSVVLPDTVGFVRYILPVHYRNITTFSTVIIRKGKNGIPRLEPRLLFTPTLYLDNKIIKNHLPTDLKDLVFVDKMTTRLDVMKTSNLNFLGWAYSYTHFLCRAHSILMPYQKKNIWPQHKKHILNKMLYMDQTFKEHSDSILNLCLDSIFRKSIVRAIRTLEMSMVNSIIAYKIDLKHGIMESAAEYLYRKIDNKIIKSKLIHIYTKHKNKIKSNKLFLANRFNKTHN